MTPIEKIRLINSLCEMMVENELKKKYNHFEKEVDTILAHLMYDDVEFSFVNTFGIDVFEKWKKASENAITLWRTDFEWVKVEITPKAVKFFRADDALSCYTYPPLHELKKDLAFERSIKELWEECESAESIKYLCESFATWKETNCDMPPFLIEQIFASDYQNYKYEDFE